MNKSSSNSPAPAKPANTVGWAFATFREWRERHHPRASYLVGPHVWRPEWQRQAEGARDAVRRALKNWEPRLTGIAYSDRALYLVEVLAELRAEHVGKILYLGDLFRADADYAEHRSKRVRLVELTLKTAPSVLEFARRRRIQVVMLRGNGDQGARRDPGPTKPEPPAPATIGDE